MPKITSKLVNSSPSKEKDYILWDDEIKGFGCRIYPKGKKTYVFRYTSIAEHKLVIMKIGTHGNITADIARDKAKIWCADLVRGMDPRSQKQKIKNEKKKEEDSALSFMEFLDLYHEKYVKMKNKASTIQRNRSNLNCYILPFLGSKKITDINHKDILNLQDKLGDKHTTFNRCYALLSKAFNMAEAWGYRPRNTNPCHGIQKFPENKKERFLREGELLRLEDVLEIQRQVSKSSPYTFAAIHMLLYTGCREGEILTLQWDDVHVKDRYLHLKDSKTGARTVPLNEKAQNILTSLPRIEGNPYVFCGKLQGQPLKEIKTTWRRVRSLAGIPDVRLHDLRHSFASFALKQGVSLYQVSKLLGHKNIQTTTRYAHLELEDLIKASNQVANVFQETLNLRSFL